MAEKVSIIVPVYNERDNLAELTRRLREVMEREGEEFEVVCIDDGSTDGSAAFLEEVAAGWPRLRLVQFRRNFGQTAAMSAGFDFAQGDVIVAMDADLQNDPADIPRILATLREGFDVVSCWRRERKDPRLTRRIPSRVANALISWISGVRLHDYGCTLKGYRRSAVEHMRLYGEMHRFIPIYASWAGAMVTEISVGHRARAHGKSKYGLNRIYKVLLDLITVKLLGSYATKPMYFFGGAGLLACLAGMFFAVWTLADKYVNAIRAHRNPLLLLAVFLFILGVQFILMGFVAELLMRTYYESQDKKPYIVKRTVGCGAGWPGAPPPAGKG